MKKLFLSALFFLFFLNIFTLSFSQNLFLENQNSVNLTYKNIYLINLSLDKKNHLRTSNIKTNVLPEENEYQKILFRSDFPKKEENNFLFFDIKNFILENKEIQNGKNLNLKKEFVYKIQKDIHTPKVHNIHSFPNNDYKKKQEFVELSNLVNTDLDIENKVNELVLGKNDTYEIAFILADWISKNIEYDISTIFESPNQTATETFEIKKGVCREISILFSSMLRNLNIPTRFAYGYAYTEDSSIIEITNNNWAAHVWVEVYIDGKWIPFDLTYFEFGYLSNYHIKFFHSSEYTNLIDGINMNSIGYKLEGFENEKEVIVENKNLFTQKNENLISKNKIKDSSDITIDFEDINSNTQNSFGYLKIKIKNHNSFYKFVNFDLFKSQKIKFVNDKNYLKQNIENLDDSDEISNSFLLRPYEYLEIYKYYKVLNSDFDFISPFRLDFNNQKISKSLSVLRKNQKVSFEELPKNKKIVFNKDNFKLEHNCFKFFNETKVYCKIENKNSFLLNNISICFLEDCKKDKISINKYSIFEKDNFNDKFVILKYENLNKKIFIKEIKKPSLEFSYSDIMNNDKINFSYKIKNYNSDISLKMNLNDEVKYSNRKTDNLRFQTNQPIKNFNVTLLFDNVLVDKSVLKLNHQNIHKNIFINFIDKLKLIFTYYFKS